MTRFDERIKWLDNQIQIEIFLLLIIHNNFSLQTSSHYFLIEELCEGGSLSHFIKMQKNKRLNEGQARSFAQQLTAAISHLHERGVVHRSVLPCRVMQYTYFMCVIEAIEKKSIKIR